MKECLDEKVDFLIKRIRSHIRKYTSIGLLAGSIGFVGGCGDTVNKYYFSDSGKPAVEESNHEDYDAGHNQNTGDSSFQNGTPSIPTPEEADEDTPVLFDEYDEQLEDFVIGPCDFNHSPITYAFSSYTNDINQGAVQNSLRSAFSLWSNQTNLRFNETDNLNNADIIFLWASFGHNDSDGTDCGNPFDGQSGTLAHARYPCAFSPSTEGHFDESETWTDTLRDNKRQPIDLVTVAAHEIGHQLGLGHSNVNSALMAPHYTGSHRFLNQDDVTGIQSIYPSDLPPPCEDRDNDGYGRVGLLSCRIGEETDCDDSNVAIHPGARELCDLLDNDCDFEVDEDQRYWNRNCGPCLDPDGDGYGETGTHLGNCLHLEQADCNNNDIEVYPGAIEFCDGKDNNCNGQIDEDPGFFNNCGRCGPEEIGIGDSCGMCGTIQCKEGGGVECTDTCEGEIAFVSDRDGNREIYLLNGAGLRNLTNNPAMDISPRWSPDGNKIVFQSNRDRGNSCGFANDLPCYDLYIINRDGTNLRRLTLPMVISEIDTGVTWHPEGDLVAFVRNTGRFSCGIFTINVNTGEENMVFNNPLVRNPCRENQTSSAGTTYFGYLGWSPDGSRLLFTGRARNSIDNNWTRQSFINTINADGSNLQELVQEIDEFSSYTTPAWSPNGNRIAFERKVAVGNGNSSIYLVNANGNNLSELVTGYGETAGLLVWSPDGRKIAFSSDGIYTVNTDEGQLTTLVPAGESVYSPKWSPDGRKIIFTRGIGEVDNPDLEIYVMNADGSDQRNITNNPAMDVGYDWYMR